MSGTDGTQVDAIVAIWRDVIRDREIGADTDLVDLGATSLEAVRIRSRIRAELGREVELIDILDNPTPRGLAGVLATAPEFQGPRPWHRLEWDVDADPMQ